MTGTPDNSALSFAAGEIIGHQLSDIAHRLPEFVAGDNFGLQRQHDQRQRAVFRHSLPRMISLVLTVSMNLS